MTLGNCRNFSIIDRFPYFLNFKDLIANDNYKIDDC